MQSDRFVRAMVCKRSARFPVSDTSNGTAGDYPQWYRWGLSSLASPSVLGSGHRPRRCRAVGFPGGMWLRLVVGKMASENVMTSDTQR